jgi:hypothetical protein
MTDEEVFEWIDEMVASFKVKFPETSLVVIWPDGGHAHVMAASINFESVMQLLRQISTDIPITVDDLGDDPKRELNS